VLNELKRSKALKRGKGQKLGFEGTNGGTRIRSKTASDTNCFVGGGAILGDMRSRREPSEGERPTQVAGTPVAVGARGSVNHGRAMVSNRDWIKGGRKNCLKRRKRKEGEKRGWKPNRGGPKKN